MRTITEIASALREYVEDVGVGLLGKPTSKSLHELRWGRHGSLSLRRSGDKRGIWYDFERGEGGDLLDLIAREHKVGLGEAARIAERDFGLVPPAPTRAKPATDDAKARTRAALRMWHETVPIAGTLAERYFFWRSAGVDVCISPPTEVAHV